ncbi:MAG: acetyl-CoA carboxylase carboxyltransferase subunit alpha [Gammaproteobacteria bacterium]|nr:acetyl-CoA carboxylase carboxyltransferase subunit alpha [Gammaproteobacteria bacterium]
MEHLEFEKPIAEIQEKLDGLRMAGGDESLTSEIIKLEEQLDVVTGKVFSNLNDWQIVQIARHPARPYFLDYLKNIFSDLYELHGDRQYADDCALLGYLARIDGKAVMVLGQEKGREVAGKVKHNFGMPKPEGYRKALRLMKLAAKFKLPIITFIDTPGAYPGIGAEERGQSEAIARNLMVMSRLPVPIISTVIGEGGSGGALAIGICDKLLMLQHSVYSVISPEGCASILWRDAKYSDIAAQAMSMTAPKLKRNGLVDEIIPEPQGGAHRKPSEVYTQVKQKLLTSLKELESQSPAAIINSRYAKWMKFGAT